MVLVILSFGFIMAVLDTTGVALAIPELEKYLSISTIQSTWIINAYILGLGGTLLLSGNLAEKYGDRSLFVWGMLMFGVASVICGFSTNFIQIILFRFIQGVGASLFMPSSMSLLFNFYDDSGTRAQMLGLWTSIISVATGTGSLIGGFLISNFGWRAIFFINVLFSLAAVIFVSMKLKNSIKAKSRKINYVDNVILVIAITTLILFLTVGKQAGYTKTVPLVLIAAFIILLVILIVRERKSEFPIVPLELLTNRVFSISNLLGFIVNISLYALVVVFGLYYQNFLHYSAMLSGLLILPGMIVLVLGNLFYAKKVKTVSSLKLAQWGIIVTIVGATVLTLVSIFDDSNLIIIIAGFAVMCLGVGLLTPATTTLLMESAGTKLASVAGATLNTNKQLGGLFGTAIVGLVIATVPNEWSKVIMIVFGLNVIMYLMGLGLTTLIKDDIKG